MSSQADGQAEGKSEWRPCHELGLTPIPYQVAVGVVVCQAVGRREVTLTLRSQGVLF